MKALKIIGSLFFGFILTIALISFCVLTASRTVVSGKFLGKMVEELPAENQKIDGVTIPGADLEISDEDFDQVLDEIEEYVPKKRVYREIGNIASQLLKYYFGVIDDIDTTELKELIEEIGEKYEEKTGKDADIKEAKKSIDEAIVEFKKEAKSEDRDTKKVLEIVGFFYKDGLYFGLLAVIIVCAIIMILINQSFRPFAGHGIAISIINGIINGIFGLLLKLAVANIDDKFGEYLADKISNVFLMMAGISFVVAFVFIVYLIITTPKKKTTVVATTPTTQA